MVGVVNGMVISLVVNFLISHIPLVFVARYNVDGWEFGCQNMFPEIEPAPECESLFSDETTIKLTCRLCIPNNFNYFILHVQIVIWVANRDTIG